MKRFILILVCILVISETKSATFIIPQHKIENDSVVLRQIVDNGSIDLKKGVKLQIGPQIEYIKSKEKEYENVDSIDIIPTICLSAFMNWCDNFIEGKKNYIVLQLPFLGSPNSDAYELWPIVMTPSKRLMSNLNVKKGPQIIFDPFIEENVMNNFLDEGKVVIHLSSKNTNTIFGYLVKLYAVIPYKGRLYKYNSQYQFDPYLNSELFQAKDMTEAIKAFGNLIASHPAELLDAKGFVLTNSYERYFKWKFEDGTYATIREMDYNPSKEIITVYQLFDYEN